MALFSFVGFESATTLGHEAVNPLRTIPRAVIQSAIFCGLFFVLCAYLETLGMAAAHQDLGTSTAPLSVLANLAGVRLLGPLIDFGALVSMFACTLACITAAARVLMRMAHNGLAHHRLSTAHTKNATPSSAVLLSGLLTVLPVCVLAARGISGIDIYGWMGSLSVYGFMTTYGLAAIALPGLPQAQPPPHPWHHRTLSRRHPRHSARPRRDPLPSPSRTPELAPLLLSHLHPLRSGLVHHLEPKTGPVKI